MSDKKIFDSLNNVVAPKPETIDLNKQESEIQSKEKYINTIEKHIETLEKKLPSNVISHKTTMEDNLKSFYKSEEELKYSKDLVSKLDSATDALGKPLTPEAKKEINQRYENALSDYKQKKELYENSKKVYNEELARFQEGKGIIRLQNDIQSKKPTLDKLKEDYERNKSLIGTDAYEKKFDNLTWNQKIEKNKELKNLATEVVDLNIEKKELEKKIKNNKDVFETEQKLIKARDEAIKNNDEYGYHEYNRKISAYQYDNKDVLESKTKLEKVNKTLSEKTTLLDKKRTELGTIYVKKESNTPSVPSTPNVPSVPNTPNTNKPNTSNKPNTNKSKTQNKPKASELKKDPNTGETKPVEKPTSSKTDNPIGKEDHSLIVGGKRYNIKLDNNFKHTEDEFNIRFEASGDGGSYIIKDKVTNKEFNFNPNNPALDYEKNKGEFEKYYIKDPVETFEKPIEDIKNIEKEIAEETKKHNYWADIVEVATKGTSYGKITTELKNKIKDKENQLEKLKKDKERLERIEKFDSKKNSYKDEIELKNNDIKTITKNLELDNDKKSFYDKKLDEQKEQDIIELEKRYGFDKNSDALKPKIKEIEDYYEKTKKEVKAEAEKKKKELEKEIKELNSSILKAEKEKSQATKELKKLNDSIKEKENQLKDDKEKKLSIEIQLKLPEYDEKKSELVKKAEKEKDIEKRKVILNEIKSLNEELFKIVKEADIGKTDDFSAEEWIVNVARKKDTGINLDKESRANLEKALEEVEKSKNIIKEKEATLNKEKNKLQTAILNSYFSIFYNIEKNAKGKERGEIDGRKAELLGKLATKTGKNVAEVPEAKPVANALYFPKEMSNNQLKSRQLALVILRKDNAAVTQLAKDLLTAGAALVNVPNIKDISNPLMMGGGDVLANADGVKQSLCDIGNSLKNVFIKFAENGIVRPDIEVEHIEEKRNIEDDETYKKLLEDKKKIEDEIEKLRKGDNENKDSKLAEAVTLINEFDKKIKKNSEGYNFINSLKNGIDNKLTLYKIHKLGTEGSVDIYYGDEKKPGVDEYINKTITLKKYQIEAIQKFCVEFDIPNESDEDKSSPLILKSTPESTPEQTNSDNTNSTTNTTNSNNTNNSINTKKAQEFYKLIQRLPKEAQDKITGGDSSKINDLREKLNSIREETDEEKKAKERALLNELYNKREEINMYSANYYLGLRTDVSLENFMSNERYKSYVEHLIILPIPEKIEDSILQDYETSAHFFNKFAGKASETLNTVQDVVAMGKTINKVAINPGNYKTWKGNSIREFSFSWNFIVESAEDGKNLLNIVSILKKSSSASRIKRGILDSKENDMLKKYGDRLDNVLVQDPCHFLFKFGNKYLQDSISPKKMALKSVQVDYTASGSQVVETTGDGVPKTISLTLQFTELDMIFEDDFNDITKNFKDINPAVFTQNSITW